MYSIVGANRCLFCGQKFDSVAEKDAHILEHFVQEVCSDCGQNLIRIAGKTYTLHDDITCAKKEHKYESQNGADDFHQVDLNSVKRQKDDESVQIKTEQYQQSADTNYEIDGNHKPNSFPLPIATNVEIECESSLDYGYFELVTEESQINFDPINISKKEPNIDYTRATPKPVVHLADSNNPKDMTGTRLQNNSREERLDAVSDEHKSECIFERETQKSMNAEKEINVVSVEPCSISVESPLFQSMYQRKRNRHNQNEKNRRSDLKILFDNLKATLPSEHQSMSKAKILREAIILCTQLTQEERDYEQQLKRRYWLQKKLECLRAQKSLSAKF